MTRIVHIVTSMGRSQRNLTNQLENVQEWARYHDFPQEMVNDVCLSLSVIRSDIEPLFRLYSDQKVSPLQSIAIVL